MMILKRLAEPFRKLEEVIKNNQTERDESEMPHVTRITGLRSMFINKLSPEICPPRLRRV